MAKPFIPLKREPKAKRYVNINVSPEEYDRISAAAEQSGVSMKSFVRQAVFYAIENMPVAEPLLIEHKS